MNRFIFPLLILSVLFQSSSCDRPISDSIGETELTVDNSTLSESPSPLDSAFCGDLVLVCPKLWRLMQEYPPRLTDVP